MRFFVSLLNPGGSLVARYGLALLSVAIALGIALLLGGYAFSLLLTAIAVAVWYGGAGPGLLAIFLSMLGVNYFFRPLHPNQTAGPNARYFVVFILFAAVMSWLSASRRRAEQSLQEARNELEARVAERTAELRRSEAYLADAQRLTHTGSSAFVIGSNKAAHWSEESYRIWGLDPQQGPPDSGKLLERIHPEDRDRVGERWETMVRARTDFEDEFRIVLPDGAVRHIHVLGHPVFSASGELIELVGTHVDVTERKRAEEERERLQQLQADLAHINRVNMMGELTASLAHEIRQPITAVITSADACLRWLRNPPDLERARLAVVRIKDDGTRAADVINHLRSFYKKGTSPEREMVDVNEVIREMIVLLRNEVNRYSVSIRPELGEGIPKVKADSVQLQQVFMNLMLNAIEAMKDTGGELTIKSQLKEDGRLLISVTDTGVGLPAEHADRIFDAFYTTKPQGSGMGLAITRSIVESHGGQLWATANDGPGATFHFTLRNEPEAHS